MAAENEEVDLDLSAMTASLQVAKSNFAHVTFRDIAETYTVGTDVVCNYLIGPALEVTNRDWVGLYKVGWRSPEQYVFYLWSPLPANYVAGKQYENQVVYPAAKLPKDDGEFYQFCYISSKGQSVRGASPPFQFRKSVSFSSSLDDLVEIEDENGELLIVKSKTAFLDEQLKNSNEKCSILKQDIQILESEKEMLSLCKHDAEQRLQRQKDEDAQLRQRLTESKFSVQKLMEEVALLRTTIAALEQNNATVIQEKSELLSRLIEVERNFVELQEVLKSLTKDHDEILGRVRTLENEKTLYQSHYTTSESTIQTHVARNDELRLLLSAEQSKTEELTKRVELTRKELAEKAEALSSHIADSEETVRQLQRSFEEAMATCVEHGQQLRANEEQQEAMLEACQKISADLEVARTESEGLKLQLQSKNITHAAEMEKAAQYLEEISQKLAVESKEKEILAEETKKLHHELDEAAGLVGTDSALYAMQAAHATLKERYFRTEKKVAKLQAMFDQAAGHKRELEQEIADQRQEIKSLKERLVMGQETYKEKFIECQQLQDRLAKRSSSVVTEAKQAACVDSPRCGTAPGLQRQESDNSSLNVIAELQTQMREFTAELERRSDRIRQLEHELEAEERTRSAAESRADDLEADLSIIQKLNSMPVCCGPPMFPPSSTTCEAAAESQSAVTAVPSHQSTAEPASHSADRAGLPEPLRPLPTPIFPERLYPAVAEASVYGGDSEMEMMGLTVEGDVMDNIVILQPPTLISVQRPPESIGEMLAQCPICQLSFPAEMSSLLRATHIDYHYQQGTCPVCEQVFCDPPALQEHINTVHFRD